MKKPVYQRWWFWVLAAVVIFSLLSHETEAKPLKASEADIKKYQEEKSSRYTVGDKAYINGVSIEFNGIYETHGKDYFSAPDGKIFIIAEFTVENNSDDDINISSVWGSSAYVDDYVVNQSMSAELSDPFERSGLTGTVPPGKKLNGIIGYEAPAQWRELEIEIKTNWYEGDYSDKITFVALAE